VLNLVATDAVIVLVILRV